MITKLRAAFTRNRIHHPRKIGGGIVGSINGAALCLAPLDGGVSFACTAFTTTLFGAPALGDLLSGAYEHKIQARLTHLGETYKVTQAEKNAYHRFERSISYCKEEFQKAYSDKRKKKFLKKAQKLADMQQWIIDGAMKRAEKQKNSDLKFEIQRGRKKPNKLGNN